MSYFAKVVNQNISIIVNGVKTPVSGGIVKEVLSAEAEFFTTYIDTSPGNWIQTSYNTKGNIHYGPDGKPDGGIPLRGNYAGIGDIYDNVNDVFYRPQPYPSWVLNTSTWLWEAPIPIPTEQLPTNQYYAWDESIQNWVVITV